MDPRRWNLLLMNISLLVISSEKEVVEMDLASPYSSMFRNLIYSLPENPLIWTFFIRLLAFQLKKENLVVVLIGV